MHTFAKERRTFLLLFSLAVPLALVLWMLSLLPMGISLPGSNTYAAGTIITVTTNADSGLCPGSSCSLRDAIFDANMDSSGNPVTITFAADYTITPASPLPDLSRSSGPTTILGDRGTGTPRIVINGASLSSGYACLRATGSQWRIQGMVLNNYDDGYGVTFRGGSYNELRNSYIGLNAAGTQAAPNRVGVLFNMGAHHNLITGNWIGGNVRHGIDMFASYDTATQAVTATHHNTITLNYIGTNPSGANLGNGYKGIIIEMDAHDNYVAENVIANNAHHGVYIHGTPVSGINGIRPPVNNYIVNNTVTNNCLTNDPAIKAKAGIVCVLTHLPISNTMTTATSGYDNVIADNLISGNVGAGIHNQGASPLIENNRIFNNSLATYGFGIYNIVDFGADANPNTYTDDVVSVPYIVDNVISGNSGVGILSLDTAPARRYELLTALGNVITTTGSDKIAQTWYAAVEVLTGTVTNTVPIVSDIEVRVFKADGSRRYDLAYSKTAGSSAIWCKDNDTSYADATTWSQFNEYTVNMTGTLEPWLTHTVSVHAGWYTGTLEYPFDGLTSTKPLSNALLPLYLTTGPFGRYQIAEVNFTYDTDGDGIPDPVEGGDDTDTDGDNIPDFQDPDSDNDGIPDDQEGGADTDGDGIPDYQDDDDDNDGIPSDQEGDTCTPDPQNPNTDQCVCNGTACYTDTDNDGIPDYQDPDDDGDGIPSNQEGDTCTPGAEPDECICVGTGQDMVCYTDTDNDGIPDYQDPDDDGDGVPSDQEGDTCTPGTEPDGCVCEGAVCYVDTDNDGIPDYQDPDDDGDGIPSDQEGDTCTAGTEPDGCVCDGNVCYVDTDNDGIPDYQDPDDDGDGIPSDQEGDTCTAGTEPDGCVCDGNVCYVDTDNDGIPDYQDPDDDGDGIPSDQEGDTCTPSTEPDGCVCEGTGPNMHCYTDTDNDGKPDYQDPDADGDGIPSDQEGDTCTPTTEPDGCVCEGTGQDMVCYTDTDNDGTPDYQDPDDDGDGIPSSEEGDTCTAGTEPDGCVCDGTACYVDTDNDGTPDYQDEDSDGDGVNDEYEAGTDPAHPRDTDGNGTPDYRDPDDDGDGIPTNQENPDPNGDHNPADAVDTDGDTIPDYLDPTRGYVLYLAIVMRQSGN